MKKTPKNIPSPYKFPGTPIFRDTTALPFASGGFINPKGWPPPTSKGISISDPKEYAYRKGMYDDSLKLHQLSYNQMVNLNKLKTPLTNISDGDVNDFKLNKKQFVLENVYSPSSEKLKKITPNITEVQRLFPEQNDFYHKKIKPTKSYDSGRSSLNFLYKKPTQPVSFQPNNNPTSPIKNKVNSYTNSKTNVAPTLNLEENSENEIRLKTKPLQEINLKESEIVQSNNKLKPKANQSDFAFRQQAVYGYNPDTKKFDIYSSRTASLPYAERYSKGWETNSLQDIPESGPRAWTINGAEYYNQEDANAAARQYEQIPSYNFADGGPLNDKTNHGEILNSVYASALGNYYNKGGMIKRADGSYSSRGLWDNIRANTGSGKAPTKEMLAQEKKINSYKDGGQFQGKYSLPEDSFRQGGKNLHDSIYASSPQQYPGIYNLGGNLDDRQQMYMPLDHVTRNGGSILSMSNTPEMSGEGKDLTYPKDAYAYNNGGNLNGQIVGNPTQQNYNTNNMMNYKSGGGIHINPAHKGDFTAKANSAGMGVQEFASKVLSAPEGQYDPSTRQQANFAKNAASWNHAMGGNMYANGGSFNNKGFTSLPTNVQNKIKSNSFAEGGSMGQLTEFNEGGTHEESPLGGIPQGTAPDGKVNLVEEGETKLNSENYVFSDTLKIDKDTMATFAIPKTDVGKTFAEVSKKANRPNSRRENDTIEQVAIKRDLDNLMNAQEAFKAKEVQKKIEEIQSLDPNALAQVAQSYQPQGMPQQEGAPQGMEEMPQEQPQGQPSQEEMIMAQGQGQPQEEQMDPAMMQQIMAQQGGQPMAYGGPMSYKCGGNMYDFGGWADTNSGTISGAGTGALSGAGTGATIGSVVPGIGTAVGAVVGGLVGGITGGLSGRKQDEAERLAQQEASNAAKQQTPEMQLQRMQDPNYMMPGGQYNLNAGGGPGFANGGHLYPTNYPTYMDNAGAMGQPLTNLYEEGGNQYGGDLDSPTEDDMIARLEQEESDMATRSFEGGGTFNVQDRDMFGSIRPSNIDYTQYNPELANPFNKEAVDAKRAEGLIPKDAKFGENTMTKEELAKYLSDLQAADETLKDKNPDLNMNQTLGQAAGLALPAAYNISQGLFGKVGKLNPEDYYQKADFTPYEYNIDPQKAQANITFAQAQAAARNAAPGAGAYLSNMQQAGLMRNDAYAKLYAEKQNIDAANALDAKVRNKAIEAANKGVLSNVTDYNIKAKEAKRQMLAAGLKQGADIAKGASEMDAQAAYMKLLAPDYAGTFNYNTIFDQLAAKRKEAKTNANNKTV